MPTIPSPEDPRSGQVLKGRYRLVRPLGEGGFGIAYLAQDEDEAFSRAASGPRRVVVKMPLPDRIAASKGQIPRDFQKEASRLTTLQHAHIVKVLDLGFDGATPFLVLEFAVGGSLADRIAASRGGVQSLDEVLSWLPDIAKALDYVAGKDVLHRDVKPSNILFDEGGSALLADFGIAKVFGGTTETTGSLAGSPLYMAPDAMMLDEERALDGRYDQYALAVTVYEALSGRFPFEPKTWGERGRGGMDDKTGAALLYRKTRDAPTPLVERAPHLGPAWAPIERALSRDRDARFRTCAEFSSALRDAVANTVAPASPRARPIPSRDETPVVPSIEILSVEPSGSTTGRRKGLWLGVAAGAVLAAVGAFLVLGRGTEGRGERPVASSDTEPPVLPREAQAPPPWREALDAASRAAEGKDWDGASKHLAEAKAKGLPSNAVPHALAGGTVPFSRVVEVLDLAVQSKWDEVEAKHAALRDLLPPGFEWPKVVDDALRPAVLAIASPTDGASVDEPAAVVRGSVVGRSGDRVEAQGKSVPVDAAGAFELPVSLGEPGSTLAVEVRVVSASGKPRSPVATLRLARGLWDREAVAYLQGWAAPLGTERDKATGFPRRIRRSKDDAEMALVPGGPFFMAAIDDGDSPGYLRMTLPAAYYMDIHEVTVGQFEKFVTDANFVTEVEKGGGAGWNEGGGSYPPTPEFRATWRSPWPKATMDRWIKDRARHPVLKVAWADSMAYARWAGVTLPTEAQFERALRGDKEKSKYPWGDAKYPTAKIENLHDESLRLKEDSEHEKTPIPYDDGFALTAPVMSFSPNVFGLYDMAGNAIEWCLDVLASKPQWMGAVIGSLEGAPVEWSQGETRIGFTNRGGDWGWGEPLAHERSVQPGDGWSQGIGFRCAKSLPAEERPGAVPAVERPAAPTPAPYPAVDETAIAKGRLLVASLSVDAKKARSSYDEGKAAKTRGDLGTSRSKLVEARTLLEGIRDRWNEFVVDLPSSKDYDAEEIASHYFAAESAQVATMLELLATIRKEAR